MSKSPAELIAMHEACCDEICGECRGDGEVRCTCYCGDSHYSDCDHCEGTGKCAVDLTVARESLEEAKRELRTFEAETAHPLTAAGFRSAYRQMFGSKAPKEAVKTFEDVVTKLRIAAGKAAGK
jgi:hypothetical protein